MDDARATSKARFLTVHEAAELLRLAPKTLYSLVSQRRILFRKAGRRLLFLESELLAWTLPKPCRRDKCSPIKRGM
jgi:excisionase family DNA binding protein